jgi:hypothetical protein
MKLLIASLSLIVNASLAWCGTITDSFNNLNPLAARASRPETIAQLAGIEAIFDFGTFTETAFFNGTTGEAASANGFLVVFGGNLATNVDAATWDVESGGPAIRGVTILGAGPGLQGLTAFDTTVAAVCAEPPPAVPCRVDATAVYSSSVAIGGNPTTNLFGSLSLTFAGPGVTPSGNFLFRADSQFLTGPVTAATAPEPATLFLTGCGLLAVGLAPLRRFSRRFSDRRRIAATNHFATASAGVKVQ